MKELFKFGGSPSKKEMTMAGIVGGICVLLIWYVIAITGIVSPKILPNPVDMLCSIPDLLFNYNLLGNIGYTVSLNVFGYVIALAIAIPLGFIIGIYPVPRTMFQNINSLEHGHYLRIQDGNVRNVEYWDLEYPEQDVPFEDIASKESATAAILAR